MSGKAAILEDCWLSKVELWPVSKMLKKTPKIFNQILQKYEDTDEFFPFPLFLLGLDKQSCEKQCLVDFCPTPKGGWKVWLVCHKCHKHRRYLFLSDDLCLCRECLGLKYRSNYQSVYNYNSFFATTFNVSTQNALLEIYPRRLYYNGKLTRFGRQIMKNNCISAKAKLDEAKLQRAKS